MSSRGPNAPPPPLLAGAETVKPSADELPPPGVGDTTVTDACVALVKSEAGIVALNSDADTYVVDSGVPFHSTVETGSKPLPAIVSVNCEAPVVAEFGVSDETVGIGYTTVRLAPADAPPPGIGLLTTKVCVPAIASVAAGTVTCSSIEET